MAEAKCILVTAVCVPAAHHIPMLLDGAGCNLEKWQWVPSSCALLGGFAIGASVSLIYDNIAPNAKCQRVLVLALRLVALIEQINTEGDDDDDDDYYFF